MRTPNRAGPRVKRGLGRTLASHWPNRAGPRVKRGLGVWKFATHYASSSYKSRHSGFNSSITSSFCFRSQCFMRCSRTFADSIDSWSSYQTNRPIRYRAVCALPTPCLCSQTRRIKSVVEPMYNGILPLSGLLPASMYTYASRTITCPFFVPSPRFTRGPARAVRPSDGLRTSDAGGSGSPRKAGTGKGIGRTERAPALRGDWIRGITPFADTNTGLLHPDTRSTDDRPPD